MTEAAGGQAAAIYEALYHAVPDPVVAVDHNLIITAVNPAAIRRFGYTESDMLGQSSRLLYATDCDHQRCLDDAIRASHAPDGSSSVYSYRTANGEVFHARLILRPLADAAGSDAAGGYLGIVHDITEFLEADEARRQADRLLAAAIDTIPEGMAVFDSEDRLLIFNKAFVDMARPVSHMVKAGVTLEALLRAGQMAGHYPEMPVGDPGTEAWLQTRLRAFHHSAAEKVVAYANGRWLRIWCSKMENGNTIFLCVDLTEAKTAEMELRRKSLEYYTLVQNIPDFISRISLDLKFTFVNDRFAASAGKLPGQMIGQPILDFAPDAEKQPFVASLRSLKPEKPMSSREQHWMSADGTELWISWSNIAIFYQDQLVEYITVGRDITALKQQESRIAQQRLELQRQNEALNQFTGTVSHDLKAPLRHLAMFSDMISEDVKNGQFDEVPSYARHLRQSALRMDRLIASLLEYAQLNDRISTWRILPLRDIIDEVLIDLDRFVRESGVRIEILPLPQVRCDPELLRRLCQNVIGNAIKYRRTDTAPVIRIEADTSSPSHVRIAFEDNGIGIDPKFGKKIFDVFQRLHRDEGTYAGTGIGLALTKRIAESHGGSIELDSTFTQGARFILTLPASVDWRRK